MLVVNGKRIEILQALNYQGDDPVLKPLMAFIAEQIKKVKELGNPIVFKDSFKSQVFVMRQAGDKVSKGSPKMPSLFVRYTGTIDSARGKETWTYAKSSTFDDNRNEKYKPRGKWMRKPWFLHPEEALELIVYMMTANAFVLIGRIILEDREKEAREKFNTDDHEFAARTQILTYGEDQQKLIDAARVVGLYNVDDLGTDQLRMRILDTMLKKHTSGRSTIDEQVKVMKDSSLSLIRIAISYAKEDHLIGWNSKGSGYWYLDRNGKSYDRIISVATNLQLRKEDLLVEHFAKNPGALDELRNALVSLGREDMVIKQFVDFSRPPAHGFDGLLRDELKLWLGHAEIEGKGSASTVDMKKLLNDYYFNEPDPDLPSTSSGPQADQKSPVDFSVLPESGTFEGMDRQDLITWGMHNKMETPAKMKTVALVEDLDKIHFPVV